MNLNNIKIATRLKLGFGAMALLIGALGALATLRVGEVQDEFNLVMKDRYPKVVMLNDVKANVDLIARAVRNVFIMTDASDIATQWADIDKANADNSKALDKLQELIKSDKGIALLKSVTEARGPYSQARARVAELHRAGKLDEARTALLKDLRPKQLDYMKRLDALIDFQDELMVASGEHVETAVVQARSIIIGFVGFAFVFAGVVAMWIVRSTTRPLNEAVEAARRVAQGDLSVDIRAEGTNETAQLLQALGDMQGRLAGIVADVRADRKSVV